MSNEGVELEAKVKYAKLVKWDNDPATGKSDKTKPPAEIREKFGDDQPWITTFTRGD